MSAPVGASWPLADAMIGWLTGPSVIQPNGDVMSWANDGHPGYVYPEIAGLLLSMLARADAGSPEILGRIVHTATKHMHTDGGVGRDGRSYVFDTAMLLRGLVDHALQGGSGPDPTALLRLYRFIVEGVAARRAVVPEDSTLRWSSTFTPHMLKVVLALEAWQAWRGDEGARERLDTIDGGPAIPRRAWQLRCLRARRVVVRTRLLLFSRGAPLQQTHRGKGCRKPPPPPSSSLEPSARTARCPPGCAMDRPRALTC